ncbi:placenta-specific gene 8 protein-like [Haliotis rufescens]|uniref:placenta-specific gene 8 protein-like n=1 Tax=Haliotis rufescens TaxID=6454 RepID=UPI001EB06A85|nr:placenta-specific gene 8 protein-like [Haliotis rufescens]
MTEPAPPTIDSAPKPGPPPYAPHSGTVHPQAPTPQEYQGPGVVPYQPNYYTPPHQQPVMQQPMPMQTMQSHNTTVVVAGLGGGGPVDAPPRGWSTGLCGCFEDVMGCLCVMFCQECYGCHLASKAGETCCLPCCVPYWLVSLRAHIRGKHNIQGSICDDCCMVVCCYQCTMCQLSREINNINNGRAAR